MSIHVNYHDYGEEYELYMITLKGDDYELIISDPKSISDDLIDNLVHNQHGCVYGGGGNSSWELRMKDDYYMVEFSISGAGGDATFKHTIYDTDMVNEVLTLIKEINCLSSNNIKYESTSHYITVEE